MRRFFRIVTPRRTLVVIAVLLVPGVWAFASPPGSSPDEDFHLASTWCAWGYETGVCQVNPSNPNNIVDVPKLAIAQTCFAHNPQQSGACQAIAVQTGQTEDCARYAFLANRDELCTNAKTQADLGPIWAGFANFNASYPPWYYDTMHLFVSSHVLTSIMAMRLVNVAIAALMFFAVFLLSRRSSRQALAASAIATSVPLGLFLIGSVNQSAWGIISVATFWVALLEGIEQDRWKRRAPLLALAAIAAGMAFATRVDVIGYIAISFVVALLLSPVAQKLLVRFWYFAAAFAGIVALLGLYLSRVTAQWRVTPHGGPPDRESAMLLLFSNAMELPQMWTGSFGLGWGLGQIDTPVPSLVSALVIPVFFFFVFLGLSKTPKMKAVALAFIFVSFSAIVLWTLQGNNMHIGERVQPRYMLPLLYLLVGAAILVPTRETGLRLSRAQRHVIVGALAIAQSVALHFTMRRYITGTDFTHWNLNINVEWWWAGFPAPMTIWLIATIAFAYLAYEALRMFGPPPRSGNMTPRNTSRPEHVRAK